VKRALSPTELDSLPALPERLGQIAADAAATAEQFIDEHLRSPVPGFVPCDFGVCGSALKALRERLLTPGLSFCEWGSGVGGVTVLASVLGFDAVGIEIDPELVDAARALAQRSNAPRARFVCGSFVPDGVDAESGLESADEIIWLVPGGADAHEELGLGIDDFDLIFAYPWPGEEYVVEELFAEHAAVGAVLLTFHGLEGVRAVRKVRGR